MSGVTHRVAEERSLALHHAVANKLRDRPELLEVARDRVQGWLQCGTVSRFWAAAWEEALSGSLDEVIARIVDTSEHARALRQSSPFAGVLSPRERWEVLRRSAGDAEHT